MESYDDIADVHEKLLAGNNDFVWAIKGQPVVALFSPNEDKQEERQHLGQPSRHNQVSDTLLLWIGLNQETGQLFVTLTQRIKVSTTRKARLYVVVVPAECLELKSAAPSFWSLSEENIPLSLIDIPTDERSAHTARLLHMSFSLRGKSKSRVIMPTQQYAGPLRPQALSLLRRLKTLSEVTQFDLFTNHNSWTQVALHKTEAMLDNVIATTPPLHLASVYPGPRDAGFDLWERQGWHEQGTTEREEKGMSTVHDRHSTTGLTGEPASKKHRFRSPSHSPPPPPYQPPSQPPSADILAHSVDPAADLSDSPVPETPMVREQEDLHCSNPRSDSRNVTSSHLDPICIDIPPRITFPTQISLWLLQAWESCPHAHYIFITNLLCLGAAALSPDANLFRAIRVESTDALLTRCAKEELDSSGSSLPPTQPLPSSVASKKRAVCADTCALISWLLILDSTADLLLFASLQRLTVIKERLLRLCEASPFGGYLADEDEDEYKLTFGKFVEMKALVISEACMRLSEHIPKRHLPRLEASMAEEMQRVVNLVM